MDIVTRTLWSERQKDCKIVLMKGLVMLAYIIYGLISNERIHPYQDVQVRVGVHTCTRRHTYRQAGIPSQLRGHGFIYLTSKLGQCIIWNILAVVYVDYCLSPMSLSTNLIFSKAFCNISLVRSMWKANLKSIDQKHFVL